MTEITLALVAMFFQQIMTTFVGVWVVWLFKRFIFD